MSLFQPNLTNSFQLLGTTEIIKDVLSFPVVRGRNQIYVLKKKGIEQASDGPDRFDAMY